MADNIRIKRTRTPGVSPTADQILEGELVLNVSDGILYTRLADVNDNGYIARTNFSTDGRTVKNKDGDTQFTL